MRAGNTANSLRPRQVGNSMGPDQVEEGVSGTQRVAEEVAQIDLSIPPSIGEWADPDVAVAPVEELIAETTTEKLPAEVEPTEPFIWDLYHIVRELSDRVASLEARIEMHNIRSSHKI
jgi:hypothetical protein